MVDHQTLEKGEDRDLEAVRGRGATDISRFLCLGITKDSTKPEVDVDSNSAG